jgi:hypothetical protein
VSDVDKHFERAKKAGATILEEPADRNMVTAVMVPKILEAISGTSRGRFTVRNRNGKPGDAESQWPNNGMQRTRNEHVSHARLIAGGGSCAPLMSIVMCYLVQL